MPSNKSKQRLNPTDDEREHGRQRDLAYKKACETRANKEPLSPTTVSRRGNKNVLPNETDDMPSLATESRILRPGKTKKKKKKIIVSPPVEQGRSRDRHQFGGGNALLAGTAKKSKKLKYVHDAGELTCKKTHDAILFWMFKADLLTLHQVNLIRSTAKWITYMYRPRAPRTSFPADFSEDTTNGQKKTVAKTTVDQLMSNFPEPGNVIGVYCKVGEDLDNRKLKLCYSMIAGPTINGFDTVIGYGLGGDLDNPLIPSILGEPVRGYAYILLDGLVFLEGTKFCVKPAEHIAETYINILNEG